LRRKGRIGHFITVNKGKSEILGVKMEIFFGKNRHSDILVREIFFRPPKLGARSSPLL